MKTLKPHFSTSKSINQSNPLRCESTFITSDSPSLLGWRSRLGRVQKQLSNLADHARLNHLITRVVKELLNLSQQIRVSKRQFIGIVLWMVGIGFLFAHLLFDPYSMEHQVCRVLGFDLAHCWNGKGGAEASGWCYTSWFDYITQIRFFVALLFWSVALPLLVPSRFVLALACILHGIGWCWILHYSFFSTSYETINAFPAWRIVWSGLVLGFSVVLSANFLIHTYNHRTLAYEKRLLTLYNGCDLLDGEQFKAVFKKYVEEKQAYQKQF